MLFRDKVDFYKRKSFVVTYQDGQIFPSNFPQFQKKEIRMVGQSQPEVAPSEEVRGQRSEVRNEVSVPGSEMTQKVLSNFHGAPGEMDR